MAEKIAEYEKKIEIFGHSYDEVLTALKHQDEKLNRTLTAIAFLTVAGVALFSNLPEAGTGFNAKGPPPSAVLFVVFLASVAIGVIVTLTGIGPGRTLPKRPSERARAARVPSLLFYARISRDKDWKSKLDLAPEALTETLASNFHEEAKSIAARTDYKVARAREANTWVQLAIVALALMGIFGSSDLSTTSQWWIGTAVLVVVLAIPLWDLLLMRATNYVQSGEFSVAAYALLVGIVVMAATLLVLGRLLDAQWQALGYCAVGFLAPRYAIVDSKAGLPLMVVALLVAVPALILAVFLGR